MKTNSNKNIDQLIKVGFRRVNLPIFVIIILTPILTMKILGLSVIDDGMQNLITLGSIFAGIIFAWLWWSYSIVKWKCNAFSKVNGNDIYILYHKAISAGLIWSTGSFFNKTEIWTKKDRKFWSTLAPETQVLFDDELFNTLK